MGLNGCKRERGGKTGCFSLAGDGSLPLGVGFPGVGELLELCRRRREEGVDTSQVERFIEEGIAAYSEGKALYAEVMLRVARDSLA